MNYDISNIQQHISNEVVTASFLKHQKQYSDSQPDLKLPQFRLKQLETQYACENINIDYQQLFEKEAKRVAQNIGDSQHNHPDNFAGYLLANYKVIKELFNPNHLSEPPPLNFLDAQINTNHHHYVMQCIRYQLQNNFVVPTLNFIENNYLHLLLEENVFPSPVKNLLLSINDDQLLLKNFQGNIPEKSHYAVFSKLNNCFYFLQYNSFTDLLSYRSHLMEIYTQFEHYIDQANQIITDPKERITFYNKIKTKIANTLQLFDVISQANNVSHSPLPNYIRKDTLAVLKQNINNNFIPGHEIIFNPGLGDFQDLQYCIGKKALLHVESKMKNLQFALKIDKKKLIPSSVQHTNLSDNDKIKTELTVNQLVYFLRCLYQEKGILDEPNKTGLLRKVASFVRSTKQENLSPISFKNKYYTFDDKVIDFWIEKFTHFLQFARKEREILFS